MRKLIWFFPLLLVVSACKQEGAADVKCNAVEKFQSNLGLINLPKFIHGDIIRLMPKTKTTDQVVKVPINPGDYAPNSTRSDTETVLMNTNFDITLSGDVTKASESVQAKIKSSISNNTMYFLTQSYRRSLMDPLGVLRKNPSAIERIKEYALADTSCIFIMVSTIIYADEFRFKVKNETSASANAHILNYGDFELKVTYECEGAIDIKSKENGIFFKPTFFKYSVQNNRIEPVSNNNINLSDYTWTNTVAR